MKLIEHKIYIVPLQFDSSKLITRATGLKYASDMTWDCDTIDHLDRHTDKLNIIDCRITEAECEFLENYISQHKTTPFMLTIADPYESKCKDHWYYKMLFRVKNMPNVTFLTKYLPAEIVKTLQDSIPEDKMVFIPYPFVDSYSSSSNFKHRRKKVIFSGSIGSIYPYRCRFRRRVKLNPLLWSKVTFLEHPGYADIGENLKHQVIGEAYIDLLSNYRFMFVSPSRCGLEFMKYRECAYARCVPIGKAPDSFSEAMSSAFLHLDFDRIYQSLQKCFSIPVDELEARSKSYYEAFAAERNPEILNKKLDAFLESRGFIE
ncbi:hypothetical protein [Leptolyngbya sp. KIOST-1]|uniref:hypothetical protein n=1 Tax=Leptolyngbya sp. KIOST-1 TaxID=1229172 RepID=UPI0005604796|nr:hypothetical protein [Leptolyngbya sp. KIOST-1]